MEKILSEILEENKGYTMYWEFNYKSNTGWKKKYFFGTIKDIEKYIDRYHKDKQIEFENLTLEGVKFLEKVYKTKFTVLK